MMAAGGRDVHADPKITSTDLQENCKHIVLYKDISYETNVICLMFVFGQVLSTALPSLNIGLFVKNLY